MDNYGVNKRGKNRETEMIIESFESNNKKFVKKKTFAEENESNNKLLRSKKIIEINVE